MNTFQTFVRFDHPVKLDLRISSGPRPRVISTDESFPEQDNGEHVPELHEFDEFPLYVHYDAQERKIMAHLSPIPSPLLLYGPEDFGPAASDSLEEHAQRVLEICGDDPGSVLQPLIDGSELPKPPKRIPREILNWRAKAILARMGLTDKISAMIEAMPEPDRTVVSAAWNGNAALARKGATVTALAAALGMSEDQVDELFLSAESINI